MTETEIHELLDDEDLDKVNFKGLNLAEGQSKTYHCNSKTSDCVFMKMMWMSLIVGKKNCLLCEAIHSPQFCTVAKEYLEDLRIKAANDKAALDTQK